MQKIEQLRQRPLAEPEVVLRNYVSRTVEGHVTDSRCLSVTVSGMTIGHAQDEILQPEILPFCPTEKKDTCTTGKTPQMELCTELLHMCEENL